MSILYMILALLIIMGLAMLLYCVLKIRGGEAIALAVILDVLLMYIGGCMQWFDFGIIVAELLAGAGLLCMVYGWFRSRDRKQFLGAFFSPSFIILILLFAVSVIGFYGDFIQTIDDFHQWAAAVRYMMEKGTFPQPADFIGSSSLPVTTGLFHLFFQLIGGYNEGNMFVSSLWLTWVGMMLPMSSYTWKDWKKAAFYFVLVFTAVYSLYNHPYKSLYVDIPVAGWSAGLIGWWMLGRKGFQEKRQKAAAALLLAAGLVFTANIKWAVGFLFDAFILFYILIQYICDYGLQRIWLWIRKYAKVMIVLLIGGIGGLAAWQYATPYSIIPGSISGTAEALTMSSMKARQTFLALITNVFGKNLNGGSSLLIKIGPLIAAICLIFLLIGHYEKKTEKKNYFMKAGFIFICGLGYLAVLYVTYVSTFPEAESISNAAVHRYFAIYAVFAFAILASSLLDNTVKKKFNYLPLIAAALLLVFGYGINKKFVSQVSSIDSESIPGYDSIQEAQKASKKLDGLVAENEKMYFLSQADELGDVDEIFMAAVLYYEEGRISNYITEPWKYMEDGSLWGVRNSEETISGLAPRLYGGGYTYLWLHTKDDYIETVLEEQYNCDKVVEDGLYRIQYEGEAVTGLELVDEL
ncbi:MAG: hypothetical protein PHR92_00850 [Lachnospiraceae bacterium]|nr:hypothetical protein [Lachnospiraceae bacterium]